MALCNGTVHLFLQHLFVTEGGEFPLLVNFLQGGDEWADFIVFAAEFGDDGEGGCETDGRDTVLYFDIRAFKANVDGFAVEAALRLQTGEFAGGMGAVVGEFVDDDGNFVRVVKKGAEGEILGGRGDVAFVRGLVDGFDDLVQLLQDDFLLAWEEQKPCGNGDRDNGDGDDDLFHIIECN